MRRAVYCAMAVFAGLCASSCRTAMPATADPLAQAYATEADWNDPQRIIALNYEQAQGQRLFYTYCVWCHADSTPAGPSNRSNLNPMPPLGNDGNAFNPLSDDLLRNVITLGGSAMGKSALMPAWGQTLSQRDVQSVIAFLRVIAVPAYVPQARPGSQYHLK